MNLLTDKQTLEATKDDLFDTMHAITAHLEQLNIDTLLNAASWALKDIGITEPLLILIGVDEWDNGYFYSGIVEVWDADDHLWILDDADLFFLHAALEAPLRGLSYIVAPIGRRATLTIDLATSTVRTLTPANAGTNLQSITKHQDKYGNNPPQANGARRRRPNAHTHPDL